MATSDRLFALLLGSQNPKRLTKGNRGGCGFYSLPSTPAHSAISPQIGLNCFNSSGLRAPRSVMIAAINSAGVTSKAGL